MNVSLEVHFSDEVDIHQMPVARARQQEVFAIVQVGVGSSIQSQELLLHAFPSFLLMGDAVLLVLGFHHHQVAFCHG